MELSRRIISVHRNIARVFALACQHDGLLVPEQDADTRNMSPDNPFVPELNDLWRQHEDLQIEAHNFRKNNP